MARDARPYCSQDDSFETLAYPNYTAAVKRKCLTQPDYSEASESLCKTNHPVLPGPKIEHVDSCHILILRRSDCPDH